MLFSQEFFDLNLKFARSVSEVTGQSFEKILLQYTHIYLAFGLGRDFSEKNSIWQHYLYRLKNESDQAKTTHRFDFEQKAKQPEKKPERAFGCFSYALWADNRVRLHFHNATKEGGALQRQNVPERIAELQSMFQHLKKTVPVTSTIVGGSWLYNIESYRRLFPANYLESAKIGDAEYQFIALWGQFLLYDGNVRHPMAEQFLEAIENQNSLEGLRACFPFQVLRLESSVNDFYAYYGIDRIHP